MLYVDVTTDTIRLVFLLFSENGVLEGGVIFRMFFSHIQAKLEDVCVQNIV